MSNIDQDSMNILDFPEEVLREILSHVPNQLVVGLVCKTFYKISCRLDTFGLKIYHHGNGYDVYGDDIYKSILFSKRKIDSMRISFDPILYNSHDTLNLKKIIQRSGRHLKKIELHGIRWSFDDFSMLNLMPNLEDLKMSYISCADYKLTQDIELRLFNLRKLTLENSRKIDQQIFDRLPKDVLLELKCNQLLENINIKQSKLKKLEIDETIREPLQLMGLSHLTKLKFGFKSFITQQDLYHICEDLKSLETLSIAKTYSLNDLSVLQNLKQLKELVVITDDKDLVRTIKSSTLHEFCAHNLSKAAFRDFVFNCPNLRVLRLNFPTSKYIDNLLDLLPKLERFECCIRASLKMSEGWENRSLKHLKFEEDCEYSKEGNINMGSLLRIARSCKSLTTFSTSLKLDRAAMQQLLIENRNLKSVCFAFPEIQIVQIIKDHGQNLESLHVQYCAPYEDDEESVSEVEGYKEVNEKLKEFFPIVKDDFDFMGYYEIGYLMMRKEGTYGNCCFDLGPTGI